MKKNLLFFFFMLSNIALFGYDEFTDPNPSVNNQFGKHVVVLTNGNVVITSPYSDLNGVTDCGAVYLFNGATHELISTLRGTSNDDRVGDYGVKALSNGNFVVSSPYWDNGVIANAGAVTWGNGTTGVDGAVSSDNSLVGNSENDKIGVGGVTALNNGNYVVGSYYWDSETKIDAGAVTWCDGSTGRTGEVSESNSLYGSSNEDKVGYGGITALTNGNYTVSSYLWNNEGISDAGALTWANGSTGITGAVSKDNSLYGTKYSDRVGYGITALNNGNYVVKSNYWDNGAADGAGAATWCNGSTGTTGAVSAENSLVGTKNYDYVGMVVVALSNGNYVVNSPYWDSPSAQNVGAVTWGNGSTGVVGEVSIDNSLVGSTSGDEIGFFGIVPLTNGNYVVNSYSWDNGTIINAGAITWCNGSTGRVGVVSTSNSLYGTTEDDQVGYSKVTALNNGNYVVCSPYWSSTKSSVGAVTWADGTTGITGPVSTSNSLVGDKGNDKVGFGGAVPLTNGNYVAISYYLYNGTIPQAGAVTLCDGEAGTVGTVSIDNSLIGQSAADQIGLGGVKALANGNYVVNSRSWDNGDNYDAGAVTWGNGNTGTTGLVNANNSLVGSNLDDKIGDVGLITLSNGNYVAVSSKWDNGTIENAGAITCGCGDGGKKGYITSSNSIVGDIQNGNPTNAIDNPTYDEFYAVFLPTTASGKVYIAKYDGNLCIDPSFDISLNQGWNLISSYMQPQSSNIEDVMSGIESNLLIAKNLAGKVYIPSYDINTIGDWDISQGYLAYMNSADQLTITGTAVVPEDTHIQLKQGWNMISYLRKTEMNPSDAFISITDNNNLLIAKTLDGKVFIPSYNINTIGNLKPGVGYKIYVNSSDTLIYPNE